MILRSKRFPPYLRRILYSYFTDTKIEYLIKDGSTRRYREGFRRDRFWDR